MSGVQLDLVASVDLAIESGRFGDADAGVVALARRFALEIEAAAGVEAEFEALLEDPELRATAYQRLQKLEGRVRAATVVGDVGPKLLAVLDAMGLSPAARVKLARGGLVADPVASQQKNALADLRDELASKRTERGA